MVNALAGRAMVQIRADYTLIRIEFRFSSKIIINFIRFERIFGGNITGFKYRFSNLNIFRLPYFNGEFLRSIP